MEIILDQLDFLAFHGALPQERVTGGHFRVSLRLQVDDEDAAGALAFDELAETVDYAEVCEEVSRQMRRPSALLEHVSARIASALVRRFEKVREVDLTLTKLAPPIPGFSGKGVSVRHVLRRSMVVWDFDGTIADTADGIVRTMTEALSRLGFPAPAPAAIRPTIGLPLTEAISQVAGIEGEALEEAVRLYREIFEEVGTAEVRLFPGVLREMEKQRARGFFVAIATNRGHQSTQDLCRKLGIASYVDFIVGCDDVAAKKPDPAPVRLLCEMAHVKPADVTVIGDTVYDIRMAINAKAGRCYGVSWGNHSPARLLEEGADAVISDIR